MQRTRKAASRRGAGAAAYGMEELVDLRRLRKLLSTFSEATGFTTGLVSHPGQELLIATGWRDACTKFHRAVPSSCAHCRRSNLVLTRGLRRQKMINVFPCENGLVDGATPIIIGGRHIASLATGQIFLGRRPGLERFRRQARVHGYEEDAYLKAISEVPVVPAARMRKAMQFLREMSRMIAEAGLRAIQSRALADGLARAAKERRRLEEMLLEISEREQQRIGRDLHDGLGQQLTGLMYMAGALAEAMKARGDANAPQMATFISALNAAIAQVRLVVRGLHPVAPPPDALRVALAELAVTTNALGRAPCVFLCSEPILVHDDQAATHLYRIAQEAVHNAVRHAGADHIWIELRTFRGGLRLQVRDDGRGLPRNGRRRGGMGLEIMRYRASVLGARFDIAARPAGGTQVTCHWVPGRSA